MFILILHLFEVHVFQTIIFYFSAIFFSQIIDLLSNYYVIVLTTGADPGFEVRGAPVLGLDPLGAALGRSQGNLLDF